MTMGEFIRDTLMGPEEVTAVELSRDELVMAARAGSKEAALQLLRTLASAPGTPDERHGSKHNEKTHGNWAHKGKAASASKATADNKPAKVESITTGDGKSIRITDAKEVSVEEFDKLHNHRDGLTDDEAAGLHRYSRTYEEANGLLRYGNWSKFPSTRKMQEEDIDVVRKAISKSTIDKDVLVTRRMGLDGFGDDFDGDVGKLVGSVYADKAFLSTSVSDKVEPGFHYEKAPVVMKIRVPKGTHGVYMDHPDMTQWPDERELLLGAGQKLAILGAKQEGGKWLVDAQVVH